MNPQRLGSARQDVNERLIPSPDEENPSLANPASSTLEPPGPLRPGRFRSLRLGMRHEQGLTENFVELSDPACQVHVRPDHREVEPRARTDVAVGRFPMMESEARRDRARKPARTVRSFELTQ